jgi:ABC-type amino acid transport system permease subunit
MNLDSLRSAAHETASFLASSVHSMGLVWPGPAADDGSGLMMPALAGVAAAFTVALMLTLYFQTGYRSYRDMIRHALVAAVGLSLLAFVIYDMRNAALAHIVTRTAGPSTQFELHWRQTTERAKAIAAEMNQPTSRPSPEARQG